MQKTSKFNPNSVALLVIDMQEYFLNPKSHAFIPSAPKILKNIIRLQNYFIDHKLPIFQTRHISLAGGNAVDGGYTNTSQMNKWWKRKILSSSSMSKIVHALQAPSVRVLKKSEYDAFFRTKLDFFLKKQGIQQVLISGVMTHLCCETTARSAFVHGYKVFFIKDATATSSERFQKASLLNLAHGFSKIVSTADILWKINL